MEKWLRVYWSVANTNSENLYLRTMEYRIDLTVINDGYTNANEVLLLYEGSVSIDKWLRYYGDFYIQ